MYFTKTAIWWYGYIHICVPVEQFPPPGSAIGDSRPVFPSSVRGGVAFSEHANVSTLQNLRTQPDTDVLASTSKLQTTYVSEGTAQHF